MGSIVKRTRLVGETEKIKSDFVRLYSVLDAELKYSPVSSIYGPQDTSDYVYIHDRLEPLLKVYVSQYNYLTTSLVYSSLIDKNVDWTYVIDAVFAAFSVIRIMLAWCQNRMSQPVNYIDYLKNIEAGRFSN